MFDRRNSTSTSRGERRRLRVSVGVLVPDAARSYAPRLALRWLAEAPDERHRRVDGSLVFLDISGFTRLSERLAAHGRAGAEEVVGLVGTVMTALVGELERWGGDVCIFAGDALVVLFEGEGSATRAARAAAEVRHWIGANGTVRTSVGRVALRVSIGVATGPIDLVLAGEGDGDRALFLVGPTTTSVVAMEREAVAGEVMLDAATAAAVDPSLLREGRAGGRLLRRVQPPAREAQLPDIPPGVDALPLVTPPLRPFLRGGAGLESEHRQATVAFVLAGGTDGRLAEPGGQDAVAADLSAWFGAACEAGERHGVTVLDTDATADGAVLFLAAGAPVATGEEEERLLRALRDILAIPEAGRLRLRAGTNRGPVFAGDLGASWRRTYTAMGDTTNLAARIAHKAEPGQLLATADVLARSETEFASRPLPAFKAKGKAEPVIPYEVGAPAGARTRAGRRLALAGRDAELRILRQALEAAHAGRGGLVEIVGEAGSGKSRLVAEVLSMPGVVAPLAVRCSTSAAATPYGAARVALRDLAGIAQDASGDEAGRRLAAWVADLLPDVAPWLPLLAIPFGADADATSEVDSLAPAFRRDRLHAELARVLGTALPAGAVVLLEDLHWADEASLALIGGLAASPEGRHLLLLALRRPGPAPVAAEPLARIELAGLPPEAVAALALDAADRPLSDADLSGIVARAAGNPLFARELAEVAAATGSVDKLPERLESLVASRIDHLDPRGRRLLRRAAVIGRVVDVDLLAEVLADEGDARDARDLGLWSDLDEFVSWEGPSVLRFRHDLVRDAAYEGLSHARRHELHRALALTIERRAGEATDPVAAELATHFGEGQLPEPAFRYARRAGDLARAQYANVDAAALYRRAMARAGQVRDLPASTVADVAESLGDVAELAGRYHEALSAYDRARRLHRFQRERPDVSGHGDAYADADWAHQDGDAGFHLARLARKSGIVSERIGRYDAAIRWYGRARRLIGEDTSAGVHAPNEDRLATRLMIDVAGIRMRQGHYAACVAAALPAVAAAERGGHRDLLANAYYLLHAAYGDLGSPEVARYRDLALPIYEELGDVVGQGNVLNNLGIEAYFEGRWDEAVDLYRRSRDAKARAGDIANAATQSNNEAEVLSDQGRIAEAERLLRDALRVWSAAGYQIGVALATSNLGRAAARAGRHDEGLELLERAAALFERIRAGGYVDETRAVASETLARVRRESEQSVLAAQLERTLAWAALIDGVPSAAAAHVAASLREARALGAAYEVATSLETAATLPDRSPADIARDRAEAASIFETLGVLSVPAVPGTAAGQ
jgi:class 3 adenylate cyclase/tetratricopeptide (TPR) repeat protein